VESGQYERATGGRLPGWYDDRPPEVRGDEIYLRAFWELSSERQFGQSVGPIPWSKVIQYGERKGLDSVMIGVLEVVMRELDEVYLKDLLEAQRKRSGRNQRKV